jgi:hypothetical protein
MQLSLENRMGTVNISNAVNFGALSADYYDGVFFLPRTRADFQQFLQKFRQLPREPLLPDMRLWWNLTEKYRREWEEELREGPSLNGPLDRYFLLTNRHPAELEDGAEVVAPVFWGLASRDKSGRLRFADEMMSGLICYGELKNPTRHSFKDLNSPDCSDHKQAA